MGRPLGAPHMGNNYNRSGLARQYPQEWELRQQNNRPGSRGERYVEELFSEDGDAASPGEDGYYDPASFNARQRAGDEMYFTGYDTDRRGGRAYYDDYYSEDDRDAVLVRSAMERASKAKAQGKTNLTLSTEEMDALERRRLVQQQDAIQLASPPTTPGKSSKTKGGRSGSLSLVSGKSRKKSSSPATPKATPKSNSKAKMTRKLSADAVPLFQPGQPVLVQGPDGIPMYAPLAYYPQDYARQTMSRSRSRSTSQSSKRETTPPDQMYAQYPPRYFPPPAGMRPSSASSTRSFSEETDRYQMPRNRSGSNMQYRYNDDYASASMPAAHGARRNVSGPPDPAYATLRRVPPASSPLAPRPAPNHSHSDPSVTGKKGARESTGSSSSDEDQGVQVDIVPEANGSGYSINRSAAKEVDSRRRKAKR